tara:strand:+ start:1974 stop:2459 length:486 start_codon:yes stop_codon:yes gene_type:complete
MSYNTDKNWFYKTVGRNIHLWQWVESASTDTVGNHKVKLPDEYYGKQLIYPDESITNGLMFEGTAFIEPFVDNDPNELNGTSNPTLTSVSVGETIDSAHINLSRMLTLAVIDYIKSQLAEMAGQIDLKEYYMKEFWKKVGDDQSNKRSVMITFPPSPFAVK